MDGELPTKMLDPLYGIKFNSNFQWSTTSRNVKDGNASHITREPDRLTVARDLLPSPILFSCKSAMKMFIAFGR